MCCNIHLPENRANQWLEEQWSNVLLNAVLKCTQKQETASEPHVVLSDQWWYLQHLKFKPTFYFFVLWCPSSFFFFTYGCGLNITDKQLVRETLKHNKTVAGKLSYIKWPLIVINLDFFLTLHFLLQLKYSFWTQHYKVKGNSNCKLYRYVFFIYTWYIYSLFYKLFYKYLLKYNLLKMFSSV